MNLIDVETDVIVGLLASSINETYKPLIAVSSESEKSKNIHLIIKVSFIWYKIYLMHSKIKYYNWIAKDTLVWQKFRRAITKTVKTSTEHNFLRTWTWKCEKKLLV